MAKWLNIGIGASNDQLKKDMDSAAGVVKAGSNTMAEAAVAGGSKMEQAHAKTTKAALTLAQQYRQADKDAQRLAETQGMTSQAFVLASQKAGELKDQLGEVRAVSAAFSSDTPILASAIPVMQGLAGAYGAAQGAAALFGAESEALQQTMLKVQAAMALMQGLQSIGTLQDSWAAFSTVLQVKVLPAILSVNGALTMGAIGIAVAAYMALSSAVDQYNGKLDREIALEKESIENKKLMADAVGKAKDEILRSKDLEIRAMNEGIEKEKAALENKKQTEIAKEKAVYAASNKTYIDINRLNANLKNIEQFYYNERLNMLKEFEAKKLTVTSTPRKMEVVQQITTTGGGSYKGPNYAPAQIKQEQFQNQSYNSAIAYASKMKALNDGINQGLENGIEAAVGGLASALGNALANGADVAEAGGAALLGAVGNMAVQLGQLAIATGIGMIAIKKAFTNPFTAIFAGAALVALGSYVASKAQAISSGGGGGASGGMSGGGGGGNMQQNFRPNYDNNRYTPIAAMIEVGGVLKGNDIILSVKNSAQDRRRIV